MSRLPLIHRVTPASLRVRVSCVSSPTLTPFVTRINITVLLHNQTFANPVGAQRSSSVHATPSQGIQPAEPDNSSWLGVRRTADREGTPDAGASLIRPGTTLDPWGRSQGFYLDGLCSLWSSPMTRIM